MSSEIITPAAAGYRWPAEWERHAATWLSWPHNRASWPGKFDVIPPQFAEMVKVLARYEPVHILAGGEAVMAEAKQLVGDCENITLWDIPTNDAWCRDHGPTFLQATADDRPPALIDWQYNAWGGKYPPFDHDNAVPGKLAERLRRRRFAHEIVLEGGAIDGNGAGLVMTTASCLLHESRNPEHDHASIERILSDYLGIRKTLWLPRGELEGDDTDGHIDQLARFVAADVILAATCDDEADENYAPLRENLEFLQSATGVDDQPLAIIPLPIPPAKYHDGSRLPTSYCNFYIANGLVIMPTFDDPDDAQALEIIGECFPQRDVIGIACLDIVWGLGTCHCLTQQEPLA